MVEKLLKDFINNIFNILLYVHNENDEKQVEIALAS